MNQRGRVRRLYYRDGLSLSEIERRTGLTRKTVRGWLKTAERTEPRYRRRASAKAKIAPFAAQLTKALEMDIRRPKRDRRTALKLLGELVGQMVSIRIDPERIDFVAHDAVVASHPRSFERQQVRYDGQHYLPLIERKPGALRHGAPFADMPEARQRLRGLLLKREGGDQIMAKVLAAVPTSGLETVLVAVERVLESGNPSAEHVENVLNRLKAAPPPDAVETHLEMAEAPLADAGRYDRLREEVSHA